MRSGIKCKKKSHCTGASDRRVGTTVAMFDAVERRTKETRGLSSFVGWKETKKREKRRSERPVNLAEGKEEKGRNKKGIKRMREQAEREREREEAKDEKEREEKGEGGSRMHRERWQFIRVPRIVDTYYHAKYNMLTTSHNRGPRSSRFSFPALRTTVRRIAFPRPENFIADAVRQMRRGSQSPGLLETRTSFGVATNQEATPRTTYDSLFMNSSFLMQNSRVARIYDN